MSLPRVCKIHSYIVLKTSAVAIAHRKMSSTLEDLKSIFRSAVSAVEPQALVKNAVKLEGGHLSVAGRSYRPQKPCYVVGFGKAVLGMALAIEEILGGNLKEGICTVPKGIFNLGLYKQSNNSKIRFIEGAHNNLPDAEAMNGALEIQKLVKNLNGEDLLIVLISGGGSALLPLPVSGITLEEKMDLIKKLGNKGADITELNCVRKRISELKGGGLAISAYPAQVISLVISDIVGDPLGFIASGPTTPNSDKPGAALDVIKKYGLLDGLPGSIKQALTQQKRSESQKIDIVDGQYAHVNNVIVGSNRKAASAASRRAESLGYNAMVLSTGVKGDVNEISKIYAELARQSSLLPQNSREALDNFKAVLFESSRKLGGDDTLIKGLGEAKLGPERDLCFITSGEPTVVVKGKGLGGRNQQLTLQFASETKDLDPKAEIYFLSCGTDGIDGPTDAAGAIGSNRLFKDSANLGLNAAEYLNDNNSYNFFTKFSNGANLVKTGHTGTNVMDIQVLFVKRSKK